MNTLIEYSFYSLWIYWGLKFGLPFFAKYFLDSGSDVYRGKE